MLLVTSRHSMRRISILVEEGMVDMVQRLIFDGDRHTKFHNSLKGRGKISIFHTILRNDVNNDAGKNTGVSKCL